MAKRYDINEWKKLTTEQKILLCAEANLSLWGTLTPPPEAQLNFQDKTCQHCGKKGPVLRDFGLQVRADGICLVQSWCKECRGSKDARPSRHGALPKTIADKLSPDEREELEAMLNEKLEEKGWKR